MLMAKEREFRMPMNVTKITKEDNVFQYFDVIKRNRKKRHRYQTFLVEGVRQINEAVAQKWSIESFLYASGGRLSDWAWETLKRGQPEKIFELTPSLMAKLSEKDDTSELLAIARMKEDAVTRISLGKNPLVVAVDRPSNHGNLGTLIRSCDAFACDGLIMTGHAVDLYHPETIAASVGTFFSVPVVRMPSHNEVMAWVHTLRKTYPDLQIVGTTVHTEQTINRCDFTRPTLLLIGNETVGLSAGYREMCDSLVKIPMAGVACGVNLYFW